MEAISSLAAVMRAAAAVMRSGTMLPRRSTSERITAASDEMASMVESLVDLMRSDMGAPPTLRRTQVDLGALAREVALDQQQHGGARQHRLRLHLPEAPVHASVDEVRVRRVVRNLVGNAAKYSEEGAEIHVAVEALQQDGQPWVRLEVRDHGMGIPERDLPHLFGRFFRGENVVGRIPGTGIGLFGAQQIVEQHGGRIEVRSREGEGSTFCVWLPAAPPPAAPQA